MKILIIPSEFYDYKKFPNAGIFQKDQAEILNSEGNQVAILAVKPLVSFTELKNYLLGRSARNVKKVGLFQAFKMFLKSLYTSFGDSCHAYSKDGIQIYKYRGAYSWNTTSNQGKKNDWLKIGDQLIQNYIADQGKPDVIHAHNLIFAGLLASFLRRKYGLPLVLTEHSSAHQMSHIKKDELFYYGRELGQIRMKNAVSPYLARILEKKYDLEEGSIQWFPNVLDPLFEQKQSLEPNKSGEFKWISVASLIPLKRHDLLLNSFKLAFGDSSKHRLEIIGEGPLRSKLSDLAEKLGIIDQVNFAGQLSRDEIKSRLSTANCLVHASDFETFGVVHIEALSMGVPVLSTNCGGPECILHKKNGILVEKNNEEALAQGMKQMEERFFDFSREEMREDIIQRFGKQSFFDRIIRIYAEALANNGDQNSQ